MGEVQLLISTLALVDCIICFVIGGMITLISELIVTNYFDKLKREFKYTKEEYKYI